MRSVIRGFALLLLVLTLGVWFSLGGSMGWTKTSVELKKVDPVTEIEYVEYQNRFVPGVEVLALGVSGAVILFALTLIQIPTRTSKP